MSAKGPATEEEKKPAGGGAAKRRGPGRPPNRPKAPALLKNGIAEGPTDAENRLELVYDDPGMFKSLFAYFKNLKAVDIHIRCTPTEITFFTRDLGGHSRVVAMLPGDSMNHFYCDDTFMLGLSRESVERIFSSVDKSFFKVTLLHRHDDPESLDIIFKDATIDKECNYHVTTPTIDPDHELFAAEDLLTPEALKVPPIEFLLTSKQFKKTVTDASHYSDTLSFEKLGSEPLQLTHSRVGIMYNEVYRSPDKIHLRADVPDGTIFRRPVPIENIKSLASAMVTDHVRIYVREDGDILFRSEIETLILSTFTRVD